MERKIRDMQPEEVVNAQDRFSPVAGEVHALYQILINATISPDLEDFLVEYHARRGKDLSRLTRRWNNLVAELQSIPADTRDVILTTYIQTLASTDEIIIPDDVERRQRSLFIALAQAHREEST